MDIGIKQRLPEIRVSIVIPCRDEEAFIERCIESILRTTLPKAELEVLVVDGGSVDGTVARIRSLQERYECVRLIDNPEQTVPYAMNLGILESRGSILVRVDAHSVYPEDYVADLVYWLDRLKADNVGGVWKTMPANKTLIARAIAFSTSHPFGIGNAQYRLASGEPREVDTVPFGCFRKSIFDEIGMFDEALIRNQDDELNARIKQHGGKIYLIPNIEIEYFARPSIRKMSRMFFQYGYYKPLVNIKLEHPATVRQFAPPLFVLFLGGGSLLSLVLPWFFTIYAVAVAAYLMLTAVISMRACIQAGRLKMFFIVLAAFPAIHVSYGAGFLNGMVAFHFRRGQRLSKPSVSISR
jgi:glycosyltransferase involved in cell wall biosynthesis